MKQIMSPSKRNRNCIDLPQLTRMKTLKACSLHIGLVVVLVKYLQKTDFTQVKPPRRNATWGLCCLKAKESEQSVHLAVGLIERLRCPCRSSGELWTNIFSVRLIAETLRKSGDASSLCRNISLFDGFHELDT